MTDAVALDSKDRPWWTYGLSFAVPKAASVEVQQFPHVNVIWDQIASALSETSFPIYPKSSRHDADLSIYVDTTASEKDTYSMGNSYHPRTQSAQADKTFEWINGIKYTQFVCAGYVRMADCSVYTFQNNLELSI